MVWGERGPGESGNALLRRRVGEFGRLKDLRRRLLALVSMAPLPMSGDKLETRHGPRDVGAWRRGATGIGLC
eukprot:2225895-Prymnesium_polylepis.1